jgi:iron(III) transport system substrate-binding protein
MIWLAPRAAVAGLVLAIVASACSSDAPGTIRVYTSVTQGTVDSVVEGFAARYPDSDVEVFRAPTGELSARIAAEQREGGITADVLWLTDPLSMQQYDSDGLLAQWTPDSASALPAAYTADTFWGTRVLTMVMVAGSGVEPPATWSDLTDSRFAGRVAFPDPGFAGSSFAVLGYFAVTDGYGMGFYEQLAANGAVQVSAPGDVVTGVAEGRFDVGITLEFSARGAVADGSPLQIIWPDAGAIALYSPIAVTTTGDDQSAARDFVEYVLGRDAQERIAASGWQPIRPDVAFEVGGPQVTVDWSVLFDRQQELLDAYRTIFGG